MIKKFYLVGLLLLCLVLSFGSSAFAHSYSQVISFGDSLSDNGNADGFGLGVSTNPNPDGTVGSVWVDYLAQDLGIGLLDMALGGARSNFHPNSGSQDLGFLWQIGFYLDHIYKPEIDSKALYTIWIGGNDLLDITDSAQVESVIDNTVTNINTGINNLHLAGVQNIILMNMPNLGLTPLMNGEYKDYGDPFSNNPNDGTALASTFNQALDSRIDPFRSLLNLMEVDVFTLMTEFIEADLFDDYEHMLQVSETPDLSYLFWDAIHPTTYAHSLIANQALNTVAPVPEPATMLLFSLGLLGLAGVSRKKQQ
ncbi:SGNH/GDSL hydrolase family protein [bacterium]|nr:SGNH/GDSL hydrolase family protein [bacterium]